MTGEAETLAGHDPEAGEIAAEAEPEDREGPTPLSDRLVEELTTYRTAGIQAALMDRPDIALIATVHALALRTFYGAGYNPHTCLKIEASPVEFVSPVAAGAAARLVADRHVEWASQLPKTSEDLWPWTVAQEADTLMRLLAYCVARTVYGVKAPWNHDPKRLAHADLLAQAAELDMAVHWVPTVDTYLGRVTKARVLEAVREGVSECDAASISRLKKHEMAHHAERLLAGRRWVPAVLRTPEPSPSFDSVSPRAANVTAE